MKNGVTAYLIQCKEQKQLDAKTVKAYRIDIAQFEDYIQSNDSQYDRESLRGFIAFLNQKYKPRTVKRKIASVKGYLSFLQDEKVISDNPFIGMQISLPKSLSIPRTIPLRTLNSMLVEAHNFEGHAVTSFSHLSALRNTAAIELLFATGMRISELCGIAGKDLDLSEGLVFIHGKGNRERIVEIANCEVLAALKKYDQAKPKHIKAFFLNNHGNPPTDQSARRIIEKCAKKLIHFGILHRTCSAILLQRCFWKKMWIYAISSKCLGTVPFPLHKSTHTSLRKASTYFVNKTSPEIK